MTSHKSLGCAYELALRETGCVPSVLLVGVTEDGTWVQSERHSARCCGNKNRAAHDGLDLVQCHGVESGSVWRIKVHGAESVTNTEYKLIERAVENESRCE